MGENGGERSVSGMAVSRAGAPPDGGPRAWFVMFFSFLCNGVIFGIINTYSVIYVQLQKELNATGVSQTSSKAALVGSLTVGTTFFLSPVAGILTDVIGIQKTTLIGGAVAALGMFMSSFLTHSVEALYLTYGILYGGGASLVYTPSLVILGHYFDRYMGMVNGFVTAGSSIFTMIMPYFIHYLLSTLGLGNTLRCLSAFMLLLMMSALVFKPLHQLESSSEKKKVSLINTEIWKERRYLIWSLIIPIALFGYFVPYVHMVKFVDMDFPSDDGKMLVLLIGVSSGVGRMIFGRIADNRRINRIILQQVSFVMIGSLTMLMTVAGSFGVLKAIALGMGLFDGCFISLLGPIAFDLCGKSGAGQAIGFLLGLCSLPLTIGPPIAGYLFDATGSYHLPFLLAGLPPIVGGLTLTLVHFIRPKNTAEANGTIKAESKDGQVEDGELNFLVKDAENKVAIVS